VQTAFIVDSFPGFHSNGECAVCHNEPSTAYNESYALEDVVADGVADEIVWSEGLGNQVRVPMANTARDVHEFISTFFAQNATHIFIRINWEDFAIDGTNTAKYADADGIAFMWNMDSDAFMSGDYFDGMSLRDGNADMVVWKAAASDVGKEDGVNVTAKETVALDGKTYDYKMTTSGMTLDTSNDYTVGATWGYQGSRDQHDYLVEIVRPLDTGDANDVTFEYNGYYAWQMALFNETSGVEHWISLPHWTYVHTGVDDPAGKTATVTNSKTITEMATTTTTVTETKTEGTTSTGDFLGITVFVAFFGMMILTYNLRKPSRK
jgi:hypothetical protein